MANSDSAALLVERGTISDAGVMEKVNGSQRVQGKPQSSLELYFTCGAGKGEADRDQLYGDATLSPSNWAYFGIAGESGFNTRGQNFHVSSGFFMNARATVMAARGEFTVEMRFKPTGVAGLQPLVGIGNGDAGALNLSWRLWMNGTNLELWLSDDGDTHTVYAASGLTLVAGADHHVRVSYKYSGTPGASSSVRISVARIGVTEGLSYLDITNAIGPLFNTTDSAPMVLVRPNATAPYTGTHGMLGLVAEVLFYAEQRGTTYTAPTAPHAPYPTTDTSKTFTFENRDAGANDATWDVSTIYFPVTTRVKFRDAANNTGSSYTYSAWMTYAELTDAGRTNPTGKYYSLQASFESDGTVAQLTYLDNGEIEFSVTVALPTDYPSISSRTLNQTTGAVAIVWVPSDVGNTGYLYRRLLGEDAWTLVDTGTGVLEDTLPAHGIYEYLVEEALVVGFTGSPPSVPVRAVFHGETSPQAALIATIDALLKADSALAAHLDNPADWPNRVFIGINERKLPPRNASPVPYIEFEVARGGNLGRTWETADHDAEVAFRITVGADDESYEVLYQIERDLAAALRAGFGAPQMFFEWVQGEEEKRGRFWRTTDTARIRWPVDRTSLTDKA